MSDEKPALTMNDLLRAAWTGSRGKVVPPDSSKGETWDGQIEKALEQMRGNGRHKAKRTDGGKEVRNPDAPGDATEGENLDPFTMNDLLRKAGGY